MSEAYSVFAEIYDECMDDIPYDAWVQYLKQLLEQYNVSSGALLAELGCGTGQVTRRLQKMGYDMIGIDTSEEMLSVAREHLYDEELTEFSEYDEADENSETSILYLQQDMREFELYGTVAAIVSLCDSINYLGSYEELVQVLKLCNNYLDPKGVVIFDLKTVHYYRDIVGEQTFQDIRADKVLIWENSFDEQLRDNEYRLTMFLLDQEEEDGTPLYVREEELHVQHAFTIEEVRKAISEAGLTFCRAYKALSDEDANEQCERVYFIAQENQK